MSHDFYVNCKTCLVWLIHVRPFVGWYREVGIKVGGESSKLRGRVLYGCHNPSPSWFFAPWIAGKSFHFLFLKVLGNPGNLVFILLLLLDPYWISYSWHVVKSLVFPEFSLFSLCFCFVFTATLIMNPIWLLWSSPPPSHPNTHMHTKRKVPSISLISWDITYWYSIWLFGIGWEGEIGFSLTEKLCLD